MKRSNNSLSPLLVRSKGFYRWAWSIIEGCRNDCWYCYARKRTHRDFREPVFREYLLDEPYRVKPSRIFVNWLGDIMGDGVKEEWIFKIINVCLDLPEHEFLFMTKLPERYQFYEFPDNCILGVTIEKPDLWHRAKAMQWVTNRKMCSVEPILGDFTGKDFSQFKFVVVGSLIGSDSHEFYETVKHDKIYYTR